MCTATAKKEKVSAIFLETNSEAVPAERDVMAPAVRQKVLSNLGFRILNFTYVQPALSEDQEKCRDLLLACHESFLQDAGTGKGVSGVVVFDWLREFNVALMGTEDVDGDEDLEKSRQELTASSLVGAKSS